MTAEELFKRPLKTKAFRVEELDQDFIVRAMTGDEEVELIESIDPKTEKPDARLMLRLALGCCLTPEGTRYFSPEQAKEAVKKLPGHCLQEIGEQVGGFRTDADDIKKKSLETHPIELPSRLHT